MYRNVYGDITNIVFHLFRKQSQILSGSRQPFKKYQPRYSISWHYPRHVAPIHLHEITSHYSALNSLNELHNTWSVMFGSRYSQNANPFDSPVAVSMTRLNDRSGPNDDSNSFTWQQVINECKHVWISVEW